MPYARDAETRTLSLLEKALLQGRQQMADAILAQLQASGAQDVHELLPHLELRGQDYIRDAEQTVQNDPNDEEAQRSLMAAYEQKAMVYEMALDRSLP